jgi:hypothetical protein
MYEADVFHMLIMQRCQWREQQQQHEQRVDLYNVVRDWEVRERERDLYPHPITTTTHVLLRNVGLLKYYEEATSLKGHYGLLVQLIHRWDVHRHAFCVGLDQWYHPTEEDMYFITGLSGEGRIFPSSLMSQVGVATEIQLMYSQRYIGVDVLSPTDFQVSGGQLWITSFSAEEVRCLSLLVTTIAHFTSDGKRISFPLLYYVDSLVQRP